MTMQLNASASPRAAQMRPAAQPMRHRTTIAAGAVVFILVVMTIYLTGYASEAGFQIPQEDVQGDYLMGVMWALALGLFIAAWPVRPEDKENLLVAWMAKCYVALILMLPYEKRYDLDCYSYFYSMRWPEYGWSWEPNLRSRLAVVGIGWVQDHVMDSFHSIKLTFALIGLVAIYLMYRAAMAVIAREHSPALLCFALFPSILFWSSIIGKDPIVFFGVALYVYGVAKWRATRRPQFLLALAGGMTIATVMRVWLGLILGIPLLYFMIRGVKGFLPRVITIGASAVLVTFMLGQFASGMDIASADDLVSTTDRIAHQFSDSRTDAAGSTRDAGAQFTSASAMILFMPVGVFSVLFRPLPGEVNNIFGLLSGLENLVLLYLALTAARSMIWRRNIRVPLLREPIIPWALILVLTWCWSYGFISVQNLGASVRFRLPIIAVFVGLLLAVRWVEHKTREAARAAEALPLLPQPVMQPRAAEG